MPVTKYTNEQMAMLAGAYAIRNKAKRIGGSYCVWDRTDDGGTENFQEITFEDAEKILIDMAERGKDDE